ncbi:MBL fold metallo-hydrolase [Prevotella sp. OH937_COT-195]|uniref:MBL fold metallo-hydrolase n=1 Tax=Prevotella sp. OH937_COT-195 TaxID=2491051 RepID=UPI0029391D92|nr:MBL fold metallo-hydrolase [Prevotella sp. OH937_COT-195]
MSKAPHDKRLRCSALVEHGNTRILIDPGPDFRQQMLSQPYRKIDAVLLTHIHYDHAGGIDDLRPFCKFGEINVYADNITSEALVNTMPYCFADNDYPGVPKINLVGLKHHIPLHVNELEVIPFEVMHGNLPITAYRIGGLAYITDMKTINEYEMDFLRDVDTLVVNALRYAPDHHSHQSVDDAVSFAEKVGARKTFFIHCCHDIGLHSEVNKKLPPDMQLAFDGQEVEVFC